MNLKFLIYLGIVILSIAVFISYKNKSDLDRWTLVFITNDQRTQISGYSSGKECVEKALELTKEGDYFNCGHDCIYDKNTSDGLRCKEYCGRGGCAKVK